MNDEHYQFAVDIRTKRRGKSDSIVVWWVPFILRNFVEDCEWFHVDIFLKDYSARLNTNHTKILFEKEEDLIIFKLKYVYAS